MTTYNGENWNWRGVGPLTRCVVSAFCEPEHGYNVEALSPQAFLDNALEAFAGLRKEDEVKAIQWLGQEGARDALVNRLSGAEEAVISPLVEDLGILAGATEGTVALAAQIGRNLQLGHTYEVKPGLMVLSELAVARLAQVS